MAEISDRAGEGRETRERARAGASSSESPGRGWTERDAAKRLWRRRRSRFLSRVLPKSLFWRSVLIVVAPMMILQAVVAYLIVERHFDGVTRQMTDGVASELRYVIEYVDEAESLNQAKEELSRATRTLRYELSLIEGAVLPRNVHPMFYDVIGRALEDEMRDGLGRRLFVAIDQDDKRVDVRVQTRWGVLKALVPIRRLVARNPHLLLTWMGIAAAALITIALIYLRNQIRPVQQLAVAAEAFGKGRSVPLRLAGANEVRLASGAFLDMRERIERHIEQRTRMLSGVSHDMRTPLTRIKLALEFMGDGEEVRAIRHDVQELELILEEFLAYARSDHGEAFEQVDIAALTREVVEETRRSGEAVALTERLEHGGGTEMTIRPTAIKRSVHNLVDNALAYGERATVTLSVTAREVQITVEDDGPGIPEDQREDAFRPFNRLEAARTRNRPRATGVGLGLALALDAVRGHGGDLELSDSALLGGLKARIRLPR